MLSVELCYDLLNYRGLGNKTIIQGVKLILYWAGSLYTILKYTGFHQLKVIHLRVSKVLKKMDKEISKRIKELK